MPINTEFLHDVYAFEFRGVKLVQALKQWSDKLAFRNAVHEFLKRDGASIERMGRKAAEFRFQCFFLGDNWRIEYGDLLKQLSENNKGLLVHPLLGPMQAACDLIESTVTVATGRNLVEFTLTFTEDRVDVALETGKERSPLELSAQAQTSAAQAQVNAEEQFQQAAALVRTYVQAVNAYTLAAEIALTDIVAASQLPSLLDAVGRSAGLATQALLIDPAVELDCDAYETIAAIEIGYAAAIAMQDAILAQVNLPVERRITVSQPLISLCQNWYGGLDAARYADIIEQINPQIDSTWVLQGSMLLIPPPTRSLG